jgi:hypothetical protein
MIERDRAYITLKGLKMNVYEIFFANFAFDMLAKHWSAFCRDNEITRTSTRIWSPKNEFFLGIYQVIAPFWSGIGFKK